MAAAIHDPNAKQEDPRLSKAKARIKRLETATKELRDQLAASKVEAQLASAAELRSRVQLGRALASFDSIRAEHERGRSRGLYLSLWRRLLSWVPWPWLVSAVRRLRKLPVPRWMWAYLQVPLRCVLLKLLTQLPPPLLYDTQLRRLPPGAEALTSQTLTEPSATLPGFARFCAHVVRVLSLSPRSQENLAANREAQRLASRSPLAKELFTSLRLDPSSPHISLTLTHEELSKVEPGLLHRRWKVLQERARAPPLSAELLAEMRRGLRRKEAARATGPEKADAGGESVDIEAVVEDRVSKILAEAERKKQEAAAEAEALWPQVEADPDYVTYSRLRFLWCESGLEAVWQRLAAVESGVGEARRERGEDFEAQRAALACELVKRHPSVRNLACVAPDLAAGWPGSAPPCGCGGSRRAWAAAQVASSLEWRTKCVWLEGSGRGHALGELDGVLFAPTGTLLPGAQGLVVAIMEAKANCYEIAYGGLWQHATRVARRCSIRTPDGLLLHLPAALHEAGCPHSALAPPCFAATTIPENDFLLGAESRIIESISEACLLNNRGLPPMDPQEDTAGCTKLYEDIRSRFELDVAPEDFLAARPDLTLVLL